MQLFFFLCKLIIRLSLVGCNMTKAAEVTVEYIVQFWSTLCSFGVYCTVMKYIVQNGVSYQYMFLCGLQVVQWLKLREMR